MCGILAFFVKRSLLYEFRASADNLFRCNSLCVFQCNFSNMRKNYESAVEKLNYLQSNISALKDNEKTAAKGLPATSLKNVKIYLKRIGITQDQLDSQLSVIHVSGTKGKGSTCAYCESLLRHCGYKTGFYSSPHLVAVRERIRINGQPISRLS